MNRCKIVFSIVCLTTFIAAASVSLAVEKMIGVIDGIEMAADGNSATVTLIDNATDEEFIVIVKDELTLEKFNDNRIVLDDEVRVKYEGENNEAIAVYFRKTAGC